MRQLILLMLMLALSACQQDEVKEYAVINASPVVATVNGIDIHESDIDTEIANLPIGMLQYNDDPKARKHILQAIIRRQAISLQAKTLGLHKNVMVQQRIQAVQQKILIEAAKSWQLSHMPAVQNSEIESYYHQHRDAFFVPAQAHARHILLENEKAAWKILKKLRRNRASFAKLAASHSLDLNNGSRGGNLNWFPRGTMVKAFDDVVFSLKRNGLSKPLKTKFGWHVIELLGKRAGKQLALEEVRDEVISILQQQDLQRWYQGIEAAADISILKSAYQ